jgi:hypothetical protein
LFAEFADHLLATEPGDFFSRAIEKSDPKILINGYDTLAQGIENIMRQFALHAFSSFASSETSDTICSILQIIANICNEKAAFKRSCPAQHAIAGSKQKLLAIAVYFH